MNIQSDAVSSPIETSDLVLQQAKCNGLPESQSKIVSIESRDMADRRDLGKAGNRSSTNAANVVRGYDANDDAKKSLKLFRLCVKSGDYIYARSNDIVMIESCDHLVKVHLGLDVHTKLTMRHGTLKDFLSELPTNQFIRIGRFCAINIDRLSGGNWDRQVFEFDYRISVKLKHPVSKTVFSRIGR